MLCDDHNRCTFNDLSHGAIDSVDLFAPNLRVGRMCPMLPVCFNNVVTELGGSASDTVFIVSAIMQTHPLGLQPILLAYGIFSNFHFF